MNIAHILIKYLMAVLTCSLYGFAQESDSVVLVIAEQLPTELSNNDCVDFPGVTLLTPGDPFGQVSIRGNMPHNTRVLFKGVEVHATCIDGMEPAQSMLSGLSGLYASTTSETRGPDVAFFSRIPRSEEFEVVGRATVSGPILDAKVDMGVMLPLPGVDVYSTVYYSHESDYLSGNGDTIRNGAKVGGLRIELETESINAGVIGQYTGFNAYAQLLMDTRQSASTFAWLEYFLLRESSSSLSVTSHAQWMDHVMDDYDRSEEEIRTREFMPAMYMPMHSQRRVFGTKLEYANSTSDTYLQTSLEMSTQRWNAEMDMIAIDDETTVAWMSNIADVEQHRITATGGYGLQNAASWLAVDASVSWMPSHLLDTRGKRLLAGWTDDIEPRNDVEYGITVEVGLDLGQTTVESACSFEKRAPKLQELYAFFFSDPYDEVAVFGDPNLEATNVFSVSATVSSKFGQSVTAELQWWMDYVANDIRTIGDGQKSYQHIGPTIGTGGVVSFTYVKKSFSSRFQAEITTRYASDLASNIPVYSQPMLSFFMSQNLAWCRLESTTRLYIKSPFDESVLIEHLANQQALLCEVAIITPISDQVDLMLGMSNVLDQQFVSRGTSQSMAVRGRTVKLSIAYQP